jgi:predicted alpha/beta-fold hydrolase
MKLIRFITIPLVVILIHSCAIKTYRIAERSAFRATPYDIGQDSIDLETYNTNYQQKWLNISASIIDSSRTEIIKSDTIVLKRDYVTVNDITTFEYFEYSPVEYDKTIVFFIGNSSRHTSYAEYLMTLSIKTKSRIISWNYRGYGYSDGKSSFKTQFIDNLEMFDKLDIEDNDDDLIIIGYSLGSTFAADLAVIKRPDKLILLSPVSDVSDILKHYKKQFLSGGKFILRPFIDLTAPDYLLNISNIEKVKQYSNDLLILHAKDDEDLPYKMGLKLFENSISTNKKLMTIKKGGHSAAFETENLEAVVRWIKNGL